MIDEISNFLGPTDDEVDAFFILMRRAGLFQLYESGLCDFKVSVDAVLENPELLSAIREWILAQRAECEKGEAAFRVFKDVLTNGNRLLPSKIGKA